MCHSGDLQETGVDIEAANLLDAEGEELMRHIFEMEEGEDEDYDEDDDEDNDDDEDDEEDEEDDEAAEEDEEDDIDMQDSRLAWLGIRAGHRYSRQLARFKKLSDCTIDALDHAAAEVVNHGTAAVNAKHCQTLVSLNPIFAATFPSCSSDFPAAKDVCQQGLCSAGCYN